MCDMRSSGAILGWVLLAIGAPTAFADGHDGGQREPPRNTQCLGVHQSTRYSGYGYDHIVEIDNACAQAMTCIVKTDVNSEAITIKVPSKEKKSVVTHRGSPASEFKADVECKVDTDG
jgi:hypothetical protein